MDPPGKGKQTRSPEKIRSWWGKDGEKGEGEGLGEHEATGYREGDKGKQYFN